MFKLKLVTRRRVPILPMRVYRLQPFNRSKPKFPYSNLLWLFPFPISPRRPQTTYSTLYSILYHYDTFSFIHHHLFTSFWINYPSAHSFIPFHLHFIFVYMDSVNGAMHRNLPHHLHFEKNYAILDTIIIEKLASRLISVTRDR